MNYMGPGPYGMDMPPQHMYPPPYPPMHTMMGMGPPYPGMGFYPPAGGIGGYGGGGLYGGPPQQQQAHFGSFNYQPHNPYSPPVRQATPPSNLVTGSNTATVTNQGQAIAADPAAYQADFPPLG